MTRNTRPTRATLLEAYADIDNAVAHLGRDARDFQADAAPELLHLIVTDETGAASAMLSLTLELQNLILDGVDLPPSADADAAADHLEDALAHLA